MQYNQFGRSSYFALGIARTAVTIGDFNRKRGKRNAKEKQ